MPQDNHNLAAMIAATLRQRGNKEVKSVFWNQDAACLSVFARSHTPEKPKSFNYAPDADLSVEEIASIIAQKSSALNE